MYCNNCGVELPEGAMFCSNCGSAVAGDNTRAMEDDKTAAGNGNAAEPETAVSEENAAEPEMAVSEENAAEPETEISEGNAAGPETAASEAGVVQPGTSAPEEDVQRRFCPNCGTENEGADGFCKECGMPLGGAVYPLAGATQGVQMNRPEGNSGSNKKKGLVIGICAVAAVLILALIVVLVSSLAMGPRGKVMKAVAATMKDTPDIVNDLMVIPPILLSDNYTAGFSLGYDGESVSAEFRNTVKDKQIYINADMDSGEMELLCGVHSGVLKAAVSDLDYVFMYDPKGENDGYLCKQVRKKELKKFNSALESITGDKVNTAEIQKDWTAACMQEFKELEFEEVKDKKFEVDKKDRECKGYRVRINEKNAAHLLENAGERISARLSGDLADDFEDIWDDMIKEVKADDFDMDINFYLYKNKLAAVIFEMKDYDEEIVIEFKGGDYRMQNIEMSMNYDGDTYGTMELSSHKKGSKETLEINVNDYEEITIIYDTKSGAVSLEFDSSWEDYLIEGTYKHSASEASFTLEEIEYDGESLMKDEDISLTVYLKKSANIEKYQGKEFDLGSVDEDDFEDLMDDLEDYMDVIDDLIW